jgi:hypothetical protein
MRNLAQRNEIIELVGDAPEEAPKRSVSHQRAAADEPRHQSSRRSNRTETSRRWRQCAA